MQSDIIDNAISIYENILRFNRSFIFCSGDIFSSFFLAKHCYRSVLISFHHNNKSIWASLSIVIMGCHFIYDNEHQVPLFTTEQWPGEPSYVEEAAL